MVERQTHANDDVITFVSLTYPVELHELAAASVRVHECPAPGTGRFPEHAAEAPIRDWSPAWVPSVS